MRTGRPKESDPSVLLEDTVEAYYWVGFILADGTFTSDRNSVKLKVGVGEDRIGHLDNLREFCNYSGKMSGSEFSAADKEVVPLLKNKFGMVERKNYNPPSIGWIDDPELFKALSVGFIDGDGYIGVQSGEGRTDVCISIKLHSSWLETIQLLADRLYAYSEAGNAPDAYVNNNGYAVVNIGTAYVTQMLRRFVDKHELPVIREKWSRVDLSYESRFQRVERYKEEYIRLVEKGRSLSEIVEMMDTSRPSIDEMRRNYDLPEPKVKDVSTDTRVAEAILRRKDESASSLQEDFDLAKSTIYKIKRNPSNYVAFPDKISDE